MARTLNEIYNSLIAGKESDSILDSLLPNPDNWNTLYTNENFKLLAVTIVKGLSVSKVAVWRLKMNIFAYQTWLLENLFDQAKTEIITEASNKVFGQLPWYVEQAKLFQLGDELVWDGTKYIYEVIDETKRIITQASATNSSGVIILKTATGDSGSFAPLSASQLTALNTYFKGTLGIQTQDGLAPAGTKLSIVSENADEMKMQVDVFVDPLVIDSSGFLVSDGTTKPVETAITTYIQELPFNAIFKVSALTDAIQAVNGVVNVVVNFCDARFGSGSYTDITAVTGRQYTAQAGYITMATGFELDGEYSPGVNTLNYTT